MNYSYILMFVTSAFLALQPAVMIYVFIADTVNCI